MPRPPDNVSFGLHFLWKRATVRRLGLGPGWA
jgi:ubiquinone/menaquinone biosynthesis C-methylase UbiE